MTPPASEPANRPSIDSGGSPSQLSSRSAPLPASRARQSGSWPSLPLPTRLPPPSPNATRVTFEGQGHVADPAVVATALVPFFEAT